MRRRRRWLRQRHSAHSDIGATGQVNQAMRLIRPAGRPWPQPLAQASNSQAAITAVAMDASSHTPKMPAPVAEWCAEHQQRPSQQRNVGAGWQVGQGGNTTNRDRQPHRLRQAEQVTASAGQRTTGQSRVPATTGPAWRSPSRAPSAKRAPRVVHQLCLRRQVQRDWLAPVRARRKAARPNQQTRPARPVHRPWRRHVSSQAGNLSASAPSQ